MSVGYSQGRQNPQAARRWLGALPTCMERLTFLWVRAPFQVTGYCSKDRPFTPLPRESMGCLLHSMRLHKEKGESKREKLLQEMGQRTFCSKFSSMKKKHRTSQVSLNGKFPSTTSGMTLASQGIMKTQFFCKRQLHTKLLSFRNISRENNGQLKRRDGHICMNK